MRTSPPRVRRPGPRAAVITLGVPSLVAAVLGIQVVVAAGRDYLVDVDYSVTATVTPPGAGRTTANPDDPLHLWVLGDSTAAGVGAEGRDSSLPVLIAERVAAAEARPVAVRGFGVSGARTLDVLEQQLPLLPTGDPAPDAVVIVIGSNDVTHVTAPWTIGDQTAAMLAAAHARTGAPVVLGGIPRFAGVGALPQPLRGVTDRYAAVLRARQRRAAQQPGVTFVDIAALASPRFIGRPDSMSRDAFHPSEVGYGFWADALAPAVIAARAER